jgi:hypothetical protein
MSVHERPTRGGYPGLELPPGVDRAHEWVLVIVTSPRTEREAARFLGGKRKVFRKLDLQDREDVRSVALMCAACRYTPQSGGDMAMPCPGVVP